MQTQVQKWGNSLALRIPIKLSHKLKLKQGTLVNMILEDDYLIISPQKYSLKDMLTEITPTNSHFIMLEDNSKGQEEW